MEALRRKEQVRVTTPELSPKALRPEYGGLTGPKTTGRAASKPSLAQDQIGAELSKLPGSNSSRRSPQQDVDKTRGPLEATTSEQTTSPQASGLHLQRGISKLDRLLKSGKHDQASGQVNDLIEIHGRQPDLTLRKGLIQISQQAPKVAPIITETIRTKGLRDKTAFFNELNGRIAHSGIPPNGESVKFTKEGKRIGVSYHLDRPLAGEPVNPKEIKERTPRVYVQDHSGLNHINWNVSVRKGMVTVVSRNLGTVIRFTNDGVTKFRPGVIYVRDNSTGEITRFKLVRSGRAPRGSGTRPCPERVVETGGDETRVIGGSDPCRGPVIYVVCAIERQ
jgi:hypothetical protein